MRGVGGAGEVEGGARRGHQSRDPGDEKLPRTDHPKLGITSDFCFTKNMLQHLYNIIS